MPNIHDLHSSIDKISSAITFFGNKLPKFLFKILVYSSAEKAHIYSRIFLRRVFITAFLSASLLTQNISETKHLGNRRAMIICFHM